MFKDGLTLSADTLKKLSAARTLRMQADDCENQARSIEDDLVWEWPDDNPEGAPLDCSDDDPDDGSEIPPTDEEPDDVKAFKAQIKFITGRYG